MKDLKNILLVEDNENDAFFVRRAFELLGYKRPLQICQNGQEAIDYIMGSDPYADRARFPFPELVLTDWKLPIAGGLELLSWMREHPHFTVMPVIVLSCSRDVRNVKDAYCAGVTAYLIKPPTQQLLAEIIRDFLQFWRHVEKPELNIHTPCETAKTEST